MGIVLDIIIVAIIALNIFLCYKKGLVNLAVGLIAFVASIILALVLYRPISNVIIQNTEFDEKIEETIIENFSAEEGENAEVRYVGIMDYIEKFVDETVNDTQNEIVYKTAEAMAIKIINVIVLIGLYIIARAILVVLTFVSDIITSWPLLKQFNKAGGILYGIVKALLIIYVVLAIVFFVVCATGNTGVSDAISNSFITKFFYNNNLLLTILL